MNPASLVELLERMPLERAGGKTIDETSQTQAQHVLARIAALTDTMRRSESNETARLASRLLLDDLATVAALFRARANEISVLLTKGLDDLQQVLVRSDNSRGDG